MALVQHRSSKTIRAKGGNLEKALARRGFQVHLRQLPDIPRSCASGHPIELHYLELGKPGELPLDQAIAQARKQRLEPACSCEFGEAILADGENPGLAAEKILPSGTIFFTVPRRKGPNGDDAVMLAAGNEIYTLKATSLGAMKTKMVLVCVPAAQAKARKS
ncbi:MAG TPA: hypothetical protein VJJ47_03190 [Candidatus Paceibacterota bacterium]